MIRKIYTLLILGLCLGFAACSDDNDGLDPNAAAPVIKFPMEQLDVDLNSRPLECAFTPNNQHINI